MAESALARLALPAKIGIGAGLLVLGAAAYYVIFYSEIAQSIEQTRAARAQLERDLASAKDAEAAYQQDLEELARRRERERELNKILPPSTEYPAFLSSVQTVAHVSGVELTAWTPQPEIQEQYYARIPMKIELTGRFHQVAKFFYGIGQNDRIMNIENILIKQPVVQDQEIYLTVSGLATAFRALEGASPETSAGQARRTTGGGG